MASLNCRYYEQEFPTEGEIVIGRIAKVAELGVFIEMIEYNNLEGLIVVGELTRKRINNAQKAVKIGKIEVAVVSRVDRRKRYIDLSRIKVSNDEKMECLQTYYRNKAAHNTMITIAQKLNIDLLELYQQFAWPKAKEHGSLYNYFVELLVNPQIIAGHEFEDAILDGVSMRFKANKVKIAAEIRVVCLKSRGVHAIKEALMETLALNKNIEVNLIKPPIYSVSKYDYDAKKGTDAINDACNRVRSKITKLGGEFSIVSPPTVFGENKDLQRIEALSDEVLSDGD